MNKLLAGILMILLSSQALALRCEGQLVYEDDSEYEVVQKCGEPDGESGDVWQDRKTLYYNNNGATESVQILNGKVTDIELNRN